jgi:hypothetical protein
MHVLETNRLRNWVKHLVAAQIPPFRTFEKLLLVVKGSKHLQPLKTAIDTLIFPTAKCQKSFFTMNIITSSITQCLLLNTMSSLMFLSMVDPMIDSFDPKDYVKQWLGKSRRDGDCMNCSVPE